MLIIIIIIIKTAIRIPALKGMPLQVPEQMNELSEEQCQSFECVFTHTHSMVCLTSRSNNYMYIKYEFCNSYNTIFSNANTRKLYYNCISHFS